MDDVDEDDATEAVEKKKRKSGIPTGNAGEYFVMGELLRRGYDAQLADRNTKGYDVLVGHPTDKELRKVQIKSVRSQPWYVKRNDFLPDAVAKVTIYVLIGKEKADMPVRYFITKNADLAHRVKQPPKWKERNSNNAFMNIKWIELRSQDRRTMEDGSDETRVASSSQIPGAAIRRASI